MFPLSFNFKNVYTVSDEQKQVVILVWFKQYDRFSIPKVSYRGTTVSPYKIQELSTSNHS